MTASLAERLLAECEHLRPVEDPELDALRRAVLLEDVLGVRLTDEQIARDTLCDATALRSLPTHHATNS